MLVIAVIVTILVRHFQLRSSQQSVINRIASVPSETTSILSTQSPSASLTAIPTELNLKVPYTSQAPTGNWDHQHEEDCEEASLLMASRYFIGESITSPRDADTGMAQIVDWENKNIGVSDSISAEQTARVAKEFLNLNARIIANPTAKDIEEVISKNSLVLVPAAGQQLGNPFYTAPGPLYHMLVLKGYTNSQFITNDPGTIHGENYPYDFEKILSANHDWNSGNVTTGARVMVVVSK